MNTLTKIIEAMVMPRVLAKGLRVDVNSKYCEQRTHAKGKCIECESEPGCEMFTMAMLAMTASIIKLHTMTKEQAIAEAITCGKLVDETIDNGMSKEELARRLKNGE